MSGHYGQSGFSSRVAIKRVMLIAEANNLYFYLLTVPGVEFSQPLYTVSELQGWIQVCATFNKELETEFSAVITSHDNTATGDDYVSVDETLIFAPGRESVECLNVTINNDDIFETSESFVLSLDVEYESISVNATVYIIDDEYTAATVEFTRSSYNVSETEGMLQICASINVEVELNVSVNIQSEDITAQGDSDYADVNQTLLFTPGGEMTLCFDVLINDDNVYERSEVFSLSLNPLESDHIQLTNSTVLVEILDDEVPGVEFSQSSYTVSESQGWVQVCSTFDKELEVEFYAIITSQDNTASDSDYADVNQTLLFTPGGEMTLCFDVLIIDDNIYERSEVFSLSLNPLESAHIQLTNSTVLVEILDDEVPGVEQTTDDNLVAGSISCLVMVSLKRQRSSDWNVKQHWETKPEDFDIDFKPPIIIGVDRDITSLSETKKVHDHEDNLDSQTLLNYLLTRSPSSTDLNTTVAVPAVHKIQPLNPDCPHTNLNSSTNPIKEQHIKSDVHPVNGYNLSVESGVVMDADHEHFSRKISDGSNNLSQGSHSYYIDIGRSTMTCSCSECKVHRERTQYSLQARVDVESGTADQHS